MKYKNIHKNRIGRKKNNIQSCPEKQYLKRVELTGIDSAPSPPSLYAKKRSAIQNKKKIRYTCKQTKRVKVKFIDYVMDTYIKGNVRGYSSR